MVKNDMMKNRPDLIINGIDFNHKLDLLRHDLHSSITLTFLICEQWPSIRRALWDIILDDYLIDLNNIDLKFTWGDLVGTDHIIPYQITSA